jgi:hypothetical protein
MSSSKKRQTMAKIARERAVKERRARKQEKKDERKQAALDAHAASDGVPPPETAMDETPAA